MIIVKTLFWLCAIWSVIIIALTLADIAQAQSPQSAVKPSYVQCPPSMAFDPKRIDYRQIVIEVGPIDKPVKCVELLDQKSDKSWCQVALICEDAT